MEVAAAMNVLNLCDWVLYEVLSIPEEIHLKVCSWFTPKSAFSPGETLFRAARRGNLKEVNFWLGHGVPPDEYRNPFGETALMMAARYGRTEMARKLLEAGADPGAQDYTNDTPLGKAAAHGHSDIIHEIAKFDPDLFTSVFAAMGLRMACLFGHTDAVVALLENGTSPNAKLLGFPGPLFAAAVCRTPFCLYEMLEAGGNVNERDERGWTPLHHASYADADTNMRILLGFHSHLDAEDFIGRTPLDVARTPSARRLLGPLPPGPLRPFQRRPEHAPEHADAAP